MRTRLGRYLVSLLDSPLHRRWARSRMGRAMLTSGSYRSLREVRRRLLIASDRRRSPDKFSAVEACFVFVGHTKSGGSLIGSLLDAHPDVVCADELGLAQMLAEGPDHDRAFRMAARIAEREALKGRVTARRLDPYSLAVPGQHQGRSDKPVVIGDSRAGPTTRYLGANPAALRTIADVLSPIGFRIIHVVRNPFDPIAAMVVRGGRTIEDAVADYAAQCSRLLALFDQMDPDALHRVRYEQLILEPRSELSLLCGFLGVAVDDGYLDACTALLDRQPRHDRHRITWDDASIDLVHDVIGSVSFLDGYRYEDAK